MKEKRLKELQIFLAYALTKVTNTSRHKQSKEKNQEELQNPIEKLTKK